MEAEMEAEMEAAEAVAEAGLCHSQPSARREG